MLPTWVSWRRGESGVACAHRYVLTACQDFLNEMKLMRVLCAGRARYRILFSNVGKSLDEPRGVFSLRPYFLKLLTTSGCCRLRSSYPTKSFQID